MWRCSGEERLTGEGVPGLGIFDISVRSLDLRRLWRAWPMNTNWLGWLKPHAPGLNLTGAKIYSQLINYYSKPAAAASRWLSELSV